MNHKENEIDESTFILENQLRKTFQPMAPNSEFVHRLKKRLVIPSEPILETDSSLLGLPVIILGFLTGLLLLIFRKKIVKIVVGAARKIFTSDTR
jgi:hypothetical protein